MSVKLIDILKDNVDEKYREFHSRLCPNTENILGIRVNVLRNIAKEMSKNNLEEFWNDMNNNYYEEIMVQGLVLGYAKMGIKEKLEYVKKFVPKIDNWAICDTFCSNLKIKKNDEQIVWDFLKQYLNSSNEFELRFAVIMYLMYFVNETYIKDVLNIINNIKSDKYYVQMGIAWLVSVAYVKQKEETWKYLLNNNLDDFTYRKSLQKIIESNRVTKEEKDEIRQLKPLRK